MTQVVSIRMESAQAERLRRLARRAGKSQSKMGAALIEEKLREEEHALIEFRGSALGRQAFMKDSTLAVWEVIRIARDLGMDEGRTASYFARPCSWVRAAFHYEAAFPKEIGEAIEDGNAVTYESLQRRLPAIEAMDVPADPEP